MWIFTLMEVSILYSYKQCIEKYKTDYLLEKSLEKKLFKIEKGIYSDKSSWSKLTVIAFKKPDSIFTMNSAFYYQDLKDEIPDTFFIATERNSTKIKDTGIKQFFYPKETLNLDVEEKKYFRNTDQSLY